MSLVAIDTPIKTVSTIQSRFISTSQIRYTYYRKDGTFTTVSKTGGDLLIIDDYTLYGTSNIGDRIYVKFDTDVVNAEGYITAKGTGLITTDIPYSSAVTLNPGFANNFDLRPNYRVKATLAEFTDFEGYYTSGAEGIVTINLGKIVKDLLLENSLTNSGITMSKTEVWEGSAESPTAETLILTGLSIRSILASNGANLWDFLLQAVAPGRLLTMFPDEELLLWDGWLRRAYSVIDPDIATRFPVNAIEWNFRNYNENKVDVSTISTPSINKGVFQIVGKIVPTSTLYYTGVSIREDVTDNQLSEIYLYENLDECRKPIMVEWLNSLGGYEQHLFELNQVFNITAKEGIIYDLGINDDIEDITKTKDRLTDGYQQTVTLQADQLTRGQLIALNEIKYSTEVRLFLSKDGTNFVNAVVFAGYGDEFSTKGALFEFFLSLQLPDNFNLLDNLGYTL